MLLREGDENKEPCQKTQGEEDTSEKGSDSKGNGRRYSRRSHPGRSGPSERGVSNGGRKAEVPAEDVREEPPPGGQEAAPKRPERK